MDWRQRVAGILALAVFRPSKERVGINEAIQPHEPHTHVEAREPEQLLICESGVAGSDLTPPSIVVGGTWGVGVQTESQNMPLISSANASQGKNGPNCTVTLREAASSSFQARRPGYLSGLPGLFKSAIIGTRIRIQFDNVGLGVSFFVPTRVSLTIPSANSIDPKQQPPQPKRVITGRMVLVETDEYGNSARFKPVRATGKSTGTRVAPVFSSNTPGRGYAVYEVYEAANSGNDILQSASIPLSVAFISNTSQNLPSQGETTASVSWAPAGPRASNPGFCDASTPRKVFAIYPVTSTLLFPFVTNQNGFDTRIVISNTSLDPLGTSTQAGKVTLYYFGGVAPNDLPPPPNTTTGTGIWAGIVPAGCQLVFTLHNGGGVTLGNCNALLKADSTTTLNPQISMAGFQGYIIAACQFQYCHGIAFVSKGGVESQAYLAIHLQRGGALFED